MGIHKSYRTRIKRLRETSQKKKVILNLLDERVLAILPIRLTKECWVKVPNIIQQNRGHHPLLEIAVGNPSRCLAKGPLLM